MNIFQYAVRAAPLASSLRDTEWRQLCRHWELRHSSLLPQSLCGRLSSSASVLCGAGSALVSMWDLCRADMTSCYLPPHLVLHLCVGGRAHATMFPLSMEACCVCRGMCDFDSPSSQELLSYAAWFLSVLCKSHISTENYGKVDLVCWGHLLFICLDFPWRADCPLLTAHHCRETTS